MKTAKMIYLSEVGSTNNWAKEHLAELPELTVIWTTNQTAGRGRKGHDWINASGKGLFYTVVYKCPMVQPSTLPQFSCMMTARAIQEMFGVEVQIKWPNDLLVKGKKITGILCEISNGCFICGIGVNMAQEQAYFDAAGLPHGSSLLLQGCQLNMESAPEKLAVRMTRELTGPDFERYAQEGLQPLLPQYQAQCVNIGRHVTFDGGDGIAVAIDEEGRLVVEGAGDTVTVLGGEVSVQGIYGAVN